MYQCSNSFWTWTSSDVTAWQVWSCAWCCGDMSQSGFSWFYFCSFRVICHMPNKFSWLSQNSMSKDGRFQITYFLLRWMAMLTNAFSSLYTLYMSVTAQLHYTISGGRHHDYPSLSLRRHTHGPLVKRLMHMLHLSGNTSVVSKSSSDWLNYTGFPGDVCVAFFNVPPGNKIPWRQTPHKRESRHVYKCDDECLSGSTKHWIFKSMWNI